MVSGPQMGRHEERRRGREPRGRSGRSKRQGRPKDAEWETWEAERKGIGETRLEPRTVYIKSSGVSVPPQIMETPE